MITKKHLKLGNKVYYIRTIDDYTIISNKDNFVIVAKSDDARCMTKRCILNSTSIFETEKEAALATISSLRQEILIIQKDHLKKGECK